MWDIRRDSLWGGDYTITAGGQPVATWSPSSWGRSGTIMMDGRAYPVKASTWVSRFTLHDPAGRPVAQAASAGWKLWEIAYGDQIFALKRPSVWRAEVELLVGGRPAGHIHRVGWRGDAVAELSALPKLLAVFAGITMVTVWNAAANAA
jgi:hypothetical protein